MPLRRAFRPAFSNVLEGRSRVSGAAAGLGHHSSGVAAETQTASTAATSPTYEELTTTYPNGDAGNVVGIGEIHGTTETEYRLTVPTGSNTTTTTDSIDLPGTAGHETVVNVATTQGNTTTENITTTLPDGSTTTETKILNTYGRKTTYDAWLDLPGVGTQTTVGSTVQSGPKAITTEVIHTAAGKVYHYHRVLTQISPLESSVSTTTTGPNGAVPIAYSRPRRLRRCRCRRREMAGHRTDWSDRTDLSDVASLMSDRTDLTGVAISGDCVTSCFVFEPRLRQ